MPRHLLIAGAAAALGAVTAVAGAQGGPAGPVFSEPAKVDNRYLPLTAERR